MKGKKDKPTQPFVVKFSVIVSVILLILTVGAAAAVGGYSLAWSRVSGVYEETTLLKARANELEAEILHLKNYAVLIDAMTTRGDAAEELMKLPPRETPKPETVVKYLEIRDTTPEGLGGP